MRTLPLTSWSCTVPGGQRFCSSYCVNHHTHTHTHSHTCLEQLLMTQESPPARFSRTLSSTDCTWCMILCAPNTCYPECNVRCGDVGPAAPSPTCLSRADTAAPPLVLVWGWLRGPREPGEGSPLPPADLGPLFSMPSSDLNAVSKLSLVTTAR